MRVGFLAMAALILAACDQMLVAEPEATWTGSIGRLVADGRAGDGLEFVHQNDADLDRGKVTAVSVDGAEIDRASRLETLGLPPRMESLQARLITTADIDADAICWLRFEARAEQPQIELGLGRLAVMVRPIGDGLEPLLARSIYIEPVWTAIDFTFAAPDDLAAGEAEIVFGFGTQLQVVDVGDVSMRCFDRQETPAELPETAFSYDGREPDASWRQTAEKQIERYRKADVVVEVVDADGTPVPDAEIRIQMSRHAFNFGVIIDAEDLAEDVSDVNEPSTVYAKNLKELFNTVAFEDGLGWRVWADEADRRKTEAAIAKSRALGLGLHGRDLVSSRTPDLLQVLRDQYESPEAIREAIRAGITATAGRLNGDIGAWDVIDQPRERRELLNLVGEAEMGTWFQLARSAAPRAQLMINEGDILAGDRMAELAIELSPLIASDVPIDLIGMQGQFDTQPPPIQVLGDRLDQLASFDLPLVVTAFDMVTLDEELQRDFARDFLTLAFSHPAVEGFVFGLYWEKEDRPGGTALYRQDGTTTPIGEMYRELVRQTWWTDIAASSDAEGELTGRIFHGSHEISAQKDGLSARATLDLDREGGRVTLTLGRKSDS